MSFKQRLKCRFGGHDYETIFADRTLAPAKDNVLTDGQIALLVHLNALGLCKHCNKPYLQSSVDRIRELERAIGAAEANELYQLLSNDPVDATDDDGPPPNYHNFWQYFEWKVVAAIFVALIIVSEISTYAAESVKEAATRYFGPRGGFIAFVFVFTALLIFTHKYALKLFKWIDEHLRK